MTVTEEDKIKCVLDVDKNDHVCFFPNGEVEIIDLNKERNLVSEYNKQLSEKSKMIKQEKIDEIMSIGKECYDSGKCDKDIVLTAFVMKACPSCIMHKPVLSNVQKIFSDAKIPFTVEMKEARDNLKEFKKLGCNATPCVSINLGKNGKKLYEGNKGEVGVISEILGVPNPLYYNINDVKIKRKRLSK